MNITGTKFLTASALLDDWAYIKCPDCVLSTWLTELAVAILNAKPFWLLISITWTALSRCAATNILRTIFFRLLMTRPITVTCARAFITVPKFYMKALSSHPSPSGLAHGWLRMPYVRQTLYSSDFQPVCRATLVWRELSAGVPRQFGERLKSSEKKLRNKKSSKSMISITLKNNAMIRILDTWILNTILLLVFFFNDKICP